MKNIETHGGFRWGPVERKLQISYSPLPPKFAVVAEGSPVSLGSHAPGSEMGVPSARHSICTHQRRAQTAHRNSLRRGNWNGALKWHRRGIEYWTSRDHSYREHSLALNACGMGDAHVRAGNFGQALADFRRASSTLKEYPRILGGARIHVRVTAGMSAAYAALGDVARAAALLAQAEALLEDVRPQTGTAPFGTLASDICHAVATAQVRNGRAAAALGSLEQAVDSGWRDWRWLNTDPELEPLRGEPRFHAIIERLSKLTPVELSAHGLALGENHSPRE